MYGYVYKTTNSINGKIYIGQHKYSKQCIDRNYIGSGKILKEAVEKYGRNNFLCEILEFCDTRKDADRLEKYYINKFDSRNRNIGYNISFGGNGGDTFSIQTKEKQNELREKSRKTSTEMWNSELKKRRNNTYLKNKEKGLHKDKHGQIPWNKGLSKGTDERVKKYSKTISNLYATGKMTPVQKGKPRTDEEKEKIRRGMLGKKNGIGNRSTAGYIWITDGNINKCVPKHSLDLYKGLGFTIGKITKKKYIQYNASQVFDTKSNTHYVSLSDASKSTGISTYYIKKDCEANTGRFRYYLCKPM